MMLTVMDRHIGRAAMSSMLVVLVCFYALTTLFAMVEELGREQQAYGAGEALRYVLYTSPRRIYELAPFVIFLGALIGLGTLAGNSEITVLRAAGTSLWRIFGALAIPVVGASLAAAALGEYAAPRLDAAGEAVRSRALQDSATIRLEGYWHRQGSVYTRIDALGTDGELIGVSQFDLRGDQLRAASRAESAVFDEGEGFWRLVNVRSTRFEEEGTTVDAEDETPWHGDVDPRLLAARALVDPRKLALADLRLQIRRMDQERLSADTYRIAFWGKAMQPLATLGLALLAVGLVVGPLREVGMGARLSVGVVAGLLFKYLQDLLAPASVVFDIAPWLAVLASIAACWAAGWVLVKRAG